jgi:methyl coenzyme M reductase beta subunit
MSVTLSSPRLNILTLHVVAAFMLLVSSPTLLIRAVLRVAFNLLIAQLLLLDLRQSKRSHALVVRFASLIVVKHDVVSRAVPMTASAADEDISIGYVVMLALRAVWRNAMAEAWIVAQELLEFETVVSSEHVRSSVLLHRVVVERSLAVLGCAWALDVVQLYSSADSTIEPVREAVATHCG